MRSTSPLVVILVLLAAWVHPRPAHAQEISATDSAQKLLLELPVRKNALEGIMALAQSDRIQSPDTAIQLYKTVIDVCRRTLRETRSEPMAQEIKFMLAAACNNIGAIYASQGLLSKSLHAHYLSLKYREEIRDTAGIAGSLNNIAFIHQYYLKDLRNAETNYLKSLQLMRAAHDESGEATTLHNLAGILKEKGELEESLTYLRESLAIHQRIGSEQGISNAYNNMAEVLRLMGRPAEGINYARKAYELRSGLRDITGLGYSALVLAKLYKDLGDPVLSRNYAQQALETGKQHNLRDLIMSTAQLLKSLSEASGDYRNALRMSELYNAFRDSVRKQEDVYSAIRLQLGYEFDKQQFEDSLTRAAELNEFRLRLEKQEIQIDNQRKLAIAAGAVALMILVSGWLYFNRNILRMKNRERELQYTALETESRLLRAQMNPHFIFNSLNSIQSFILDDDTRSARHYLNKFSRLVRAILEQSRKDLIPLNEEIALLRLYLELENVRMSNQLQISITYAEELPVHSIRIPPMLIQPFVENSIIHGLRMKEGDRRVDLSFRADGSTLHCTIEDNGIGRERSRTVNSENALRKSSMSTDLARKRLALIVRPGSQAGAIVYTDLQDAAGKAAGTRVDISIPFTLQA